MNHDKKANPVSTTTVSDIMSTSLITISSKSNMYDVAKRMSEYRISSIFLTDEGNTISSDLHSSNESKIVGIITQTDLVQEICAKDMRASMIDAESIMSPLVTISDDAKVEDATLMMIEMRVRHLAVRERGVGGKILGIITGTDLGRYLKQKLMQDQKGIQYRGEELSIANILSNSDLDKGNQDKQC